MYTLLTVLIIIACVLLILIVLVQNPKGGGLSATFGGVSSSFMGVKRTTDFLEKATWTLAIALLSLSLATSIFIERGTTVTTDPSLDFTPVTQQAPDFEVIPEGGQPGQPAQPGQTPAGEGEVITLDPNTGQVVDDGSKEEE